MIAVMVAKWIADAFGKEGIYGTWIAMRRYPWLAPMEYKDKGEVAGEFMIPVSNLVVIRSGIDTLKDLGSLIKTWEYNGFPVVGGNKLLGFVSRDKLVNYIGAFCACVSRFSAASEITSPHRAVAG